MPANARSLQITNAYRARLADLAEQTDRAVRRGWASITIDDLADAHTRWAASVASVTTVMQQTGVRLAAGYAWAFVASETGQRGAFPALTDVVSGLAEDGQPLIEALGSPLIGVRAALKDGKPPEEALSTGLDRGLFIAGGATTWAARSTLSDLMTSHDQIVGWRRVSGGGCGACMAAATGAIHQDDEALEVHANCQCTTEPVVKGVPDRVAHPTGPEIFASLPKGEQDARLGPEAAELLRTDRISFNDLIERQPMAAIPDQITQAPVKAAA
jgi:hypothetical protein